EGDGQGAGNVVARVAVGPALADHRYGRQRGDDGDGHVDQEAPAPGGELGEHAAQDQADGGAAPRDGPVDAERRGPLFHLGEGHGDEREGGRGQEGGEGPLQGPGPEQHARADGDAAQGRSSGEAEQPDNERPLPADVVGDTTAQKQQPTEGQG